MDKESKGNIEHIINSYNTTSKEIMITANIICQDFKMELNYCINKICTGFILGFDHKGEYLFILKEYSQIMSDNGINIDEFFNLIQYMDYLEQGKVVTSNIAKMSKDGQSANSLRSR